MYRAAFVQATDFESLIHLVSAAEARFRTAGIDSPREQIKILRGIYYGTPWSLDYQVERSPTRILGFRAFTGSPRLPADPVPLLGRSLFDALQASQDVADEDRLIDLGHFFIALDARSAPLARLPVPGFGGTGLELVTWLGDLGAAVAWLALARAGEPSTSVSTSFRGTDCGGAINLEGDVAGYVVARAGATGLSPPVIPAGQGVSHLLNDYLLGNSAEAAWRTRGTTFLRLLGAKFDRVGTIQNQTTMIAAIAKKARTFAWHYLAMRLHDRRTTSRLLVEAGDHVGPAALEVAETFFTTLEECHRTGQSLEASWFPGPRPPIAGLGRLVVKTILLANLTEDLLASARRRARGWASASQRLAASQY